MDSELEFHPVTPERWADLERLFGPRGACGGCWCMLWRLRHAEFEAGKGEGNRQALREIVEAGPPPGILAYAGGEPAGWCAVAPREAYPRLDRSPVLKQVDDAPVWSIVCLYVAPAYRRHGTSRALIAAAARYAASRGATLVEAYPVEPRRSPMPDVFASNGLAFAYASAGFREVARRSETRPIMRLPVVGADGPG